ncbi:MAG: hypothetical protein ACI8PZ_005984 [Myxococcota bacterium]
MSVGGDCDDADHTRYPGAPESCNDRDDDCDGSVDEGVRSVWWLDADGDSWGSGLPITACSAPPDHVHRDGDCDDANSDIHPEASERCTGLDDDCDGLVDEVDPDLDPSALVESYPDLDGDGYGDEDVPSLACAVPNGHVLEAGDCDDRNPSAHAIESWWWDGDGDGWGDGEDTDQCGAEPGFVRPSIDIDCDDGDPGTWPGAPELCDSPVDRDCDGDSEACTMHGARWIGRGSLDTDWAGAAVAVSAAWDPPVVLIARTYADVISVASGPLEGELPLDAAPLQLASPDDDLGFGADILTTADLTGDGVADWVIGAVGAEAAAGAVRVYAPGVRLVEPPLALTVRGSFGAGSQFGKRPAVGDLDGDGTADLVVQDVDWSRLGRERSALAVHAGPLSGDVRTADAAHVWEVPPERTLGGGAALVFDANSDGVQDMLIALPSAGEPLEYQLLLGPAPPSGLLSDVARDWTAADDTRIDAAGTTGAVGDANGDGHVDVLLTSDGETVAAFRVDGPMGSVDAVEDATTWTLARAHQHGRGVLLVDLDGGGVDETVTGGSMEHLAPGLVATFRHNTGGASVEDADTVYEAEVDGGTALGLHLAAWPDADGDGGAEVLVSDTSQDAYTGAVYLLYGADLLR